MNREELEERTKTFALGVIRSRDDFIHKVGIVEKEAAETQYWLELCQEADLGSTEERRLLLKESGELLAIFASAGKTAKARS